MQKEFPSAKEWLERLKKETGSRSDVECAKNLKTSKQTLINWAKGHSQIGIAESVRLGALLRVDPLFLLICSKYNTAKKNNAENHEKWRRIYKEAEEAKKNREPVAQKGLFSKIWERLCRRSN